MNEVMLTVRCGNSEPWNEDIHRSRAKIHPELTVSHFGTVENKQAQMSEFHQSGGWEAQQMSKWHEHKALLQTFFSTVSDFI